MARVLRPALTLLALSTLALGLAYPALVTGFGRLAFPFEAGGSIVSDGRGPAGSALLGQAFSRPENFWGRPSATEPGPCNAAASAGSNLGPSNPGLAAAVRQRVEALRAADPGNRSPVPVDLVTASGSGLDPHISPAAADFQVARVARARGLPEMDVRRLVAAHTRSRLLGFLGEPRVNVVLLNLALKSLEGQGGRW